MSAHTSVEPKSGVGALGFVSECSSCGKPAITHGLPQEGHYRELEKYGWVRAGRWLCPECNNKAEV